jgi:hypothetical protein
MKWKIYFLLFGSVLSLGIFTTSAKTAHAIESYKISPEDDRTIRRGFHSNSNIKDEKHIDLHYYFYAQNNYSENLRVIAYICDYKADYYNDNSITSVPDCGLSMVQEAGKFKIKINAGYYASLEYSRRTQKIITSYYNYNSVYNNQNYDIASFTDQDFEKGLTLLGGSTLKANNWNRNEGGFLVDPVGGNSNSSNSSNNSSNNGGGFDIFGGIKAFFQPMIDSITRTQKAVLGISDTIINGIKKLFSSLIESVKNIWDFLTNFFTKLVEELGKFVKWIFVPESDVLTKQIKGFTDLVDLSFQPLKQTLGIDFVDPMYLNTNRCNGSPMGLTGNGDGRFSGMNGFSGVIEINICKVPAPLIFLARNLFRFSVIFVLLRRLSITLPIVFGSRYVWERSDKGDSK